MKLSFVINILILVVALAGAGFFAYLIYGATTKYIKTTVLTAACTGAVESCSISFETKTKQTINVSGVPNIKKGDTIYYNSSYPSVVVSSLIEADQMKVGIIGTSVFGAIILLALIAFF